MKSLAKFLLLLVTFTWAFAFVSTEQATSAEAVFTDTEGHEYEESIEYLSEREVVQGYSNGEFRPGRRVNRAELLKMIFAALGEDIDDDLQGCFPDVAADDWFAPYVCLAQEEAIVQGYVDGYFRPAQDVTIIEALKMMNEAFGSDVPTEEDLHWYTPYLEYMHRNNILSKYSVFPDAFATRGEVAYWLHQLLLIEEGEREVSLQRDARSAGCSLNPPANAPTNYTVRGQARSTITVVPDSYNKDTPLPLIIAFHGRTNSNEDVQGYYRIERASGDKAIIVYPAGVQKNGSFTWSDSGDDVNDLRDYEFFDLIVEEMMSSYCINEDQIYAMGHSLGAWFTNSLACTRGDVLRAVATLGGSRTEGDCTGPVAAMQWHNPNDRLAPFYTGLTARDYYLEQNRCSDQTVSVAPYWANCVAYSGCYDDADFLWCPHTNDYADYSGEYYPHNWPRSTGEEMWSFFMENN